ncbi:MAG TPA: hypothetical protein PKE12_07300 [Kiritimatiellia bacterium]|nr:hypothetical protein [Kiritimatiellia bacterium]
MICRQVGWAGCLVFILAIHAFPCPTVDEFGGASIDTAIWGSANTGAASAPSQTGGKLITTVTGTGQNQRSLIYSLRTNLNFFARSLTLSADIAALGGTGSDIRPVNRYLLIGSFGTGAETFSRYYPGTELTYGVWLSAGQTNGVNYLEVGTVRIGNVTAIRQVYSGVLTNMSLLLDKTSFSVTASGTGGFSVGSGNSFTGTLANVVEADYAGRFRFAMGAANSYQGAVTAGASAEWNNVSIVPTPAPVLSGDEFNGVSLNAALWGATQTGVAAPSVANGKLTTPVTTNSQNQRALIYSLRTNLNFFAQSINLSADIAALGGTGSQQFPVNRYFLIGSFGTNTEVLSQYYPGSELRFGVWLTAGQTNGVNYLELGTVRIGTVTAIRQVYTGVLTNMSLVLNKTAFSVTASGTGGFSVGSGNSFTGTLANVLEVDYAGRFRFALGAANSYQGAVTAGASAEWHNVSLIYADDSNVQVTMDAVSSRSVTNGQPVVFSVNSTSADCTIPLLRMGGLPSGATFTVVTNVAERRVTGTFSWTPSVSPGTHSMRIYSWNASGSTSSYALNLYVDNVGQPQSGGVWNSQTNWRISVSALRAPSSGNATLVWHSVTGVTYDVYASSLPLGGGAFWGTPITSGVEAAGVLATAVVASGGSMRFYQVVPQGMTRTDRGVWGVVRPSVPSTFHLMSPPLVSTLSFADGGSFGQALSLAVPVGAKVHIATDATPSWLTLVKQSGGTWRTVPANTEYTTPLNAGQAFYLEGASGSSPAFTGAVRSDGTQSYSLGTGINPVGIAEGRPISLAATFSTSTMSSPPVGNDNEDLADILVVQHADGTWRRIVRLENGTWWDMRSRGATTVNLQPGEALFYVRRGGSSSVSF